MMMNNFFWVPNNLHHQLITAPFKHALVVRRQRFSLNVMPFSHKWRIEPTKRRVSPARTRPSCQWPLRNGSQEDRTNEGKLKVAMHVCNWGGHFMTRPNIQTTQVPSICAAHETLYAARPERIEPCGSRSRRIELTGCMMNQITRNSARTSLCHWIPFPRRCAGCSRLTLMPALALDQTCLVKDVVQLGGSSTH